jgi:hypothetical protein
VNEEQEWKCKECRRTEDDICKSDKDDARCVDCVWEEYERNLI